MFASFELPPAVSNNLQRLGFTEPTPVQARAIPVIQTGRDAIALASTGTGKTAAFLLPILGKLLAGTASRAPRCLILAPTRELAEQIKVVARDLSRGTDLQVTTVFGGVSSHAQISQLRRGVDIVVGCPGRVLDLVSSNHLSLKEIQIAVLDEADQLFDMGFMPTIERIFKKLPVERQTLMFSATMSADVERLARDVLRTPERIEVDKQKPAASISHLLLPVQHDQKKPRLVALMQERTTDTAIVFTRTKHRAKLLSRQLDEAGLPSQMLQGNMSQGQRKQAMQQFRDGRCRVLVATDVAARGIDVPHVSLVVNFDMPVNLEWYIHRIGRTGRASAKGESITFVTSEDRGMARALSREFGVTMEGLFPDRSAPVEREYRSSHREDRPRGARRPNLRHRDGESRGRDGGERSARSFRGERENVTSSDERRASDNRPHGERSFRSGERKERGSESREPRFAARSGDRRERPRFGGEDSRRPRSQRPSRFGGEARSARDGSPRDPSESFGRTRSRDERAPRGESRFATDSRPRGPRSEGRRFEGERSGNRAASDDVRSFRRDRGASSSPDRRHEGDARGNGAGGNTGYRHRGSHGGRSSDRRSDERRGEEGRGGNGYKGGGRRDGNRTSAPSGERRGNRGGSRPFSRGDRRSSER